MKILILYAMAGGGHKAAALAAREYLVRAFPHAQVRVEDGLKALVRLCGPVNWACCEAYKGAVKRAPWIYAAGYRAADREGLVGRLIPLTNAYLSRWLYPSLKAFEPDVVISTFHFLGQMVSRLIESGAVDTKLIQLVTDYAPCRPWVCKRADAYVVADRSMIPQMEARGVAGAAVYPLGIPVRAAFFSRPDQTLLRGELGLDASLPTLLLMGGSFGVRRLLAVFRELLQLPEAFQIVAIAGNDAALRNALERAASDAHRPTRILGFSTQVERYMHAADLLITKAGGLTVSEALACDLPIVCYDAIPGQEENNARFLQHAGMGVYVRDGSCAQAVAALLGDRERLYAMRERCRAYDKSSCEEALAHLVARLTGQSGVSSLDVRRPAASL